MENNQEHLNNMVHKQANYFHWDAEYGLGKPTILSTQNYKILYTDIIFRSIKTVKHD